MPRARRHHGRFLLLPLVFLLLVGARSRPARPIAAPGHDAFSFAEPHKAAVRHLSLDLTVDFAARRIHGTASLRVENLTDTPTLVLDTRDLQIFSVAVNGRTVAHELGSPTAIGQALRIPIGIGMSTVTVVYSTSPDAPALQWATPDQTYGRSQPYLYTQSEPDYARSWIPLQDTPSARLTYDATVRVPAGLLALMSASNPVQARSDGIYRFQMEQPIPAYLIALAVGRLEFRAFDERSGVYAEPELIEDAARELEYIPAMVAASERLLGPYPWGRYDVLLMPPTYILGGMEHARLNFLNPFAVVTGDHLRRHMPASLVAHELAHSWAGNLATLAAWTDVWINEGITSYLTLRILEEISGPERSDYGFFLDRRGFEAYVANPHIDPRQTVLHRHFQPGEPAASAFNTAAYVKGELFMKMLEDTLGREALDAFLRQYFQRFAFRSVTDRDFLAALRQFVRAERPQAEPLLAWTNGSTRRDCRPT